MSVNLNGLEDKVYATMCGDDPMGALSTSQVELVGLNGQTGNTKETGMDAFTTFKSCVGSKANNPTYRVNPYCCNYRSQSSHIDGTMRNADSQTNPGRMMRKWLNHKIHLAKTKGDEACLDIQHPLCTPDANDEDPVALQKEYNVYNLPPYMYGYYY